MWVKYFAEQITYSCSQMREILVEILHGITTNMWQSHVEIEGYSVAYFDRIVAFGAPYHWISVKGGAHTRFVDSWDIHTSTKHIWAPPLTKFSDTALQTQPCDRSTWRNNFRFLRGTATYVISTSIFVENNTAHGNTSVKPTRVFYMKTATRKEDK